VKDLRDLEEHLDRLETELRSLYRIAGEEASMTLNGARRWNRQTERLDDIMDTLRQDAEMLIEGAS
jgi:cob(I)alamin adenosyltransferase